jgi:hypothetical protein
MMKAPSCLLETARQQFDAGVNPIAVQLMAEAHADDPALWGEGTVIVSAPARNGQVVFMVLSTERPSPGQFATWPAAVGRRTPGAPSREPA